MSYFLVVSIVVAFMAILYVWYVTRGMNYIKDDDIIYLHTEDDKQLANYYKSTVSHSYSFTLNNKEIARRYLDRIHNIQENANNLVLGNNLDQQYYRQTGKHLTNIYNLRDDLGIKGEIAIVYNDKIRKSLNMNNNLDLSFLESIMDSDIDKGAHEYMKTMLKFRWDKILSLNDPNVLNNNGSYLYYNIESGSGDVPNVIDNITVLRTDKGGRLNLLCSNYEFEALINRWKAKPIML